MYRFFLNYQIMAVIHVLDEILGWGLDQKLIFVLSHTPTEKLTPEVKGQGHQIRNKFSIIIFKKYSTSDFLDFGVKITPNNPTLIGGKIRMAN
jgi:hypothetical protein